MGFIRLAELLSKGSLPETFAKRLKEARAISRWENVVGATIAKYAHAVRVEEGILHVEVSHPIWRSELHHRRRQILELLNQSQDGGEELLKDLHFVDPKSRTKAAKIAKSTTPQNQGGAKDPSTSD